ncbi:uncharacterized protein C8R40DRAFT_1170286 [Lentinula edodes]|uniref:uncharacterized protein n=1 Tax=Lentinula edodes TaxID=5353 RepID=UPI001E8E8A39|nr:uncharacterized protein C8R40DRAFT_1170286 [Lentinula edodes]KAH7875674.1 hypothetical protein C8R40DRAFT_1170286 [Lentinula edodes]
MTNTNEGNLFVNQTDVFMDASTYAGESRHGGSDSHMPNFLHVTKTHFMSMASTRSRYGEFVPPAMHGMDISYYFPSTSPITSPITLQNPRFSAAFSQSFLSFVFSLNPHNKINPREDITPPWPMYPIADMGMVFNKTAVGNGNDVHPVQVDDGLLQRCSFRESLGALTGQ